MTMTNQPSEQDAQQPKNVLEKFLKIFTKSKK